MIIFFSCLLLEHLYVSLKYMTQLNVGSFMCSKFSIQSEQNKLEGNFFVYNLRRWSSFVIWLEDICSSHFQCAEWRARKFTFVNETLYLQMYICSSRIGRHFSSAANTKSNTEKRLEEDNDTERVESSNPHLKTNAWKMYWLKVAIWIIYVLRGEGVTNTV